MRSSARSRIPTVNVASDGGSSRRGYEQGHPTRRRLSRGESNSTMSPDCGVPRHLRSDLRAIHQSLSSALVYDFEVTGPESLTLLCAGLLQPTVA